MFRIRDKMYCVRVMSIVFLVAVCCVSASEALSCLPCSTLTCTRPHACPGGVALELCGCCQVCAKVEGERCGGPWNIEGVCDTGLLCIPDDPYSISQRGTCQELSPCLTFGCDIEEGMQCQCKYSSSCPAKVFQYDTKWECEDGLKKVNCETMDCPKLNCADGMVYEPGFVMPGECCPSSGACICDYSQCNRSEWPRCPLGWEPVMVALANETEGRCCNVFECTKVTNTCLYGGTTLLEGDSWQADPCTTCACVRQDLVKCTSLPCPLLDCQKTYFPEGECCPVCFPLPQTLPPDIDLPPVPFFSSCVSSSGEVYQNEERWQEGPCESCFCDSGKPMCSKVQCMPMDCMTLILPPNSCCPVCIEEELIPTSVSSIQMSSPAALETPQPTPSIPTVTMDITVAVELSFDSFLEHEGEIVDAIKNVLLSEGVTLLDLKPQRQLSNISLVLSVRAPSTAAIDAGKEKVASMLYRLALEAENPKTEEKVPSKPTYGHHVTPPPTTSSEATIVLVLLSVVALLCLMGTGAIVLVLLRRQLQEPSSPKGQQPADDEDELPAKSSVSEV